MRSNSHRSRRSGLLVRLVLSFVVLGALFLAAFSLVSYYYARRALEKEMDLRIVSAARAVAKSTPYESLSLLSHGREDSLTHRSLLRTLNNLKDALGAERIFIFNPATYRLLVDTKTKGIGIKYHRLFQDRSEINTAWRGTPSASIMFRGPKDRLYKSGYAAIEGPSGPVAIAGVEADVKFFDELARLKKAIAISLTVILILLAMTAFVLARKIQKPVVDLVAASNRIAEGDLGSTIETSRKDEIGALARTMENMRKAILQRDENLQLLLRAVAHEVRNPLHSIRLSAELLAEDLADNPRYKKRLSKITEELDVLNRLVSSFLEYARKWELMPERANVLSLAKKAWALVPPRLKEGVSVEIDIPPDLEWPLDKNQLGAAILNLMVNSCQALEGERRVEVAAREQGGSLVFEIEDSGPGIPEDVRDKIFEPFFSTRAKGSGLGLALVKKVVTLHNGRIEASSSGKLGGAKFTITIPKAEEEHGQDIDR